MDTYMYPKTSIFVSLDTEHNMTKLIASTICLLIFGSIAYAQPKVYRSKHACYSTIVRDKQTDAIISTHQIGWKDEKNMFGVTKDSIYWYNLKFHNELEIFRVNDISRSKNNKLWLYRATDSHNVPNLFAFPINEPSSGKAITVTTETALASYIIE